MKPIVHQRNPTRKPVVFHDSADTFQSTRATCRPDERFGGLFRMFAASAYDQEAASIVGYLIIVSQMGEYLERGLDEAFFALSHRTRRQMLVHLSEARETRVTDLAQRYRLSLNSVSKHVAVLERARLVRRRVAGREHFIEVVPARLTEAERWLHHHRRFWTERLDALAAHFGAKAGS